MHSADTDYSISAITIYTVLEWSTHDGMMKLSSLMYCGFFWRVRDVTTAVLVDTNRLYLVSVASDYKHMNSWQSQAATYTVFAYNCDVCQLTVSFW